MNRANVPSVACPLGRSPGPLFPPVAEHVYYGLQTTREVLGVGYTGLPLEDEPPTTGPLGVSGPLGP